MASNCGQPKWVEQGAGVVCHRGVDPRYYPPISPAVLHISVETGVTTELVGEFNWMPDPNADDEHILWSRRLPVSPENPWGQNEAPFVAPLALGSPADPPSINVDAGGFLTREDGSPFRSWPEFMQVDFR